MNAISLQQELKDALRKVEDAFNPDELAYLALTQKVEHAFRDKLAFVLHKRLTKFVVCREWKRADLAILNEVNPVLILEAKAGYTFDLEAGYDFPALVEKDLRKAASLAAKNSQQRDSPEIYALVIATHPHTAPDANFRQAIKYYSKIKRYAASGNTYESCQKVMDVRMAAFERLDCHKVVGGEAFGIKVSVFIWLYRSIAMEAVFATS